MTKETKEEAPKEEGIKEPKKQVYKIEPNQRVFIAGMTGSGKTVKARQMLLTDKRLIVLDTKDNLSVPDNPEKDWKLTKYTPAALAAKTFRLHVTNMDEADEIAFYAMQAGNCRIYIDEAYSVWEGSWNTPDLKYLKRAFTQGREKGVGMWVACQRPADIPVVIMSECNWFFIFRLQNEDDRNKLAKNVNPRFKDMVTTEHGYFVYGPKMKEPQLINVGEEY